MNINKIGVAVRQGEILDIRTTERGLACRSSIQEPCSNSKITAASYVWHYLASNAVRRASIDEKIKENNSGYRTPSLVLSV